MKEIDNPVDAPEPMYVDHWEEAVCDTTVMVPREYLEGMSFLGMPREQEFMDDQVVLKYDIPLTDMIGDLFDRLKSASSGYASVEYKITGYKP